MVRTTGSEIKSNNGKKTLFNNINANKNTNSRYQKGVNNRKITDFFKVEKIMNKNKLLEREFSNLNINMREFMQDAEVLIKGIVEEEHLIDNVSFIPEGSVVSSNLDLIGINNDEISDRILINEDDDDDDDDVRDEIKIIFYEEVLDEMREDFNNKTFTNYINKIEEHVILKRFFIEMTDVFDQPELFFMKFNLVSIFSSIYDNGKDLRRRSAEVMGGFLMEMMSKLEPTFIVKFPIENVKKILMENFSKLYDDLITKFDQFEINKIIDFTNNEAFCFYVFTYLLVFVFRRKD